MGIWKCCHLYEFCELFISIELSALNLYFKWYETLSHLSIFLAIDCFHIYIICLFVSKNNNKKSNFIETKRIQAKPNIMLDAKYAIK